ncbi:MAG: vWA domain-containing protein, partial [Bacteroidota bacterium]
EKNSYAIQSIQSLEKNIDNPDCDWSMAKDHKMSFESVTQLDVVMVLDASESLGENFQLLKQYSKDFASSILTKSESTEIGLVGFANNIQRFPLRTKAEQVSADIDKLQTGEHTALYEALNAAIDLLASSRAEARALLVFTDGFDDHYTSPINLDFVKTKLGSIPGAPVSVFGIGFTNTANHALMHFLAKRDGMSEIAEDADDLQGIFTHFANVIPHVYTIRYTGSPQVIPADLAIELRFQIEGVIR